MQQIIRIPTDAREGLYDLTKEVEALVLKSGVKIGLANVYVRGATAGIMIQENWDQSVQNDVLALLRKIIPAGVWEHDQQDGNGDAHLKACLVGPDATIPIMGDHLAYPPDRMSSSANFTARAGNRRSW